VAGDDGADGQSGDVVQGVAGSADAVVGAEDLGEEDAETVAPEGVAGDEDAGLRVPAGVARTRPAGPPPGFVS